MTRSPIAEPASLHRIAAHEFTQRRASLRAALDRGAISAAAANASAQLWLAIAASVGAPLPELSVETLFPIGGKRWLRADDIADPAAIRAEAARARDNALTRAERQPGDLKADQRARDLIALAEALGAPGIDWSPKDERKAA